jgi:predicted nucleic acid-binding protein
MILDSNLIIYAAKAEYAGLRQWVATEAPAVSAVSMVGVLGYHKLSVDDRFHIEAIFAAAQVLPVSAAVIARAVTLRQARKMSLGHSLVAATALVFGHALYSHNVKDYESIPSLIAIDPIATS